MIKVLMCGPIVSSGGVSNHTINLTRSLRKLDVNVILFNLYGTSTLKKIYCKSIGLMYFCLKNNKEFDIIHMQVSGGFFSFVSVFFSSVVSNMFHKTQVITFHYRPSRGFILRYKLLFNYVLRSSKVFLVVSQKQKIIIDEVFQCYSHKTFVVSNGFDETKFKSMPLVFCRNILKLDLETKIILSVGNLVKEKGYDYLIESADNIINKRGKNVVFIIIGSGPLQEQLETKINQLNLANNFYILGFKNHSEIPLWMNASNLFVLSSLVEGNPTVMFEALGTGLPFVGTNVGGVPEIITSETYGILCNYANSNELTNAILVALDTNWDRRIIQDYSRQFTWTNVANVVKSFYEN